MRPYPGQRRRDIGYAVVSIADALVVLGTWGFVKPSWAARYYEIQMRRVAAERRGRG